MSRRARLVRLLARYAAYHQDPVNIACHLVGVPLLTFTVLLALAHLPLPLVGHAAAALVLVCGAGYLALDRPLALLTLAWVAPLLGLASRQVAGEGAGLLGAGCFLVGWAFQLFGHLCEGRKPALVDDLFQALVAPLFITFEVVTRLGLARDLAGAVATRARGL